MFYRKDAEKRINKSWPIETDKYYSLPEQIFKQAPLWNRYVSNISMMENETRVK